MKAGAIVLCTIIVTLLLAVFVSSPRSDAVAAVFPPWWSAAHTFIAASSVGDVIASGPLPSILIVRGKRADLGVRLRAAGALMLVDPGSIGCTPNLKS